MKYFIILLIEILFFLKIIKRKLIKFNSKEIKIKNQLFLEIDRIKDKIKQEKEKIFNQDEMEIFREKFSLLYFQNRDFL